MAKAVNFGVIYGQTAFGLAKTLGIPQGKAARYIKKYFERIPGVSAYMDGLVERAKRVGEATTILGRTRRIPELGRRGPARAYGEHRPEHAYPGERGGHPQGRDGEVERALEGDVGADGAHRAR